MRTVSGEDVWCPACPAVKGKSGRRYGHRLDIDERSYHGTGADMAHCDNCNRVFSITYVVDTVEHVTGWGGNDEPFE